MDAMPEKVGWGTSSLLISISVPPVSGHGQDPDGWGAGRPCHKGWCGAEDEGKALIMTPTSFSASSEAPPFQTRVWNWGWVGSDSTTKSPCALLLALFHTIRDIMSFVLRNGGRPDSDPIPQAQNAISSLSHLTSMHIQLTGFISTIRTVWHTGCPKYGREGLRVLGTWIKPGWGLGITEIGRTGIFSPRNNL